MMQIIPAIDILGGQCVRLERGRFDKKRVFSEEPVEVAREWERQGAQRLHVVDLDGARQGRLLHWDLVEGIVGAVSIPVQVGGGIRTLAAIQRALALGVERVVVGTAALDPVWAGDAFRELGERLVAGLDAAGGKVVVRGWQEATPFSAAEWARHMEQLGARRIIFTDVSRDGTMTGPNLEGVKEILEAVKVPVIASGGISCQADLEALERLGVEGAIVGLALYTGAVRLGGG